MYSQPESEYKICSHCGKSKPKSKFGFSKSKKDGYQDDCKKCRKERYDRWAEKNPHKVKEINAKRLQEAQTRVNNKTCRVCGSPVYGLTYKCKDHWFLQAATSLFADKGQSKKGGRIKVDGFSLEDRKRIALILEAKLISQDFRCPYTDKLLIPGDNCWLDHKQSVCKHPELRHDMNNIEWVDKLTNRSKQEMSKAEYYEHCYNVVHTVFRKLANKEI